MEKRADLSISWSRAKAIPTDSNSTFKEVRKRIKKPIFPRHLFPWPWRYFSNSDYGFLLPQEDPPRSSQRKRDTGVSCGVGVADPAPGGGIERPIRRLVTVLEEQTRQLADMAAEPARTRTLGGDGGEEEGGRAGGENGGKGGGADGQREEGGDSAC